MKINTQFIKEKWCDLYLHSTTCKYGVAHIHERNDGRKPMSKECIESKFNILFNMNGVVEMFENNQVPMLEINNFD